MEEDNTNISRVRIHVGGLGESVTDNDLQKLFGSLGSVDGVDIIRTKGRSFAYVDFIPSPTDEKSLPKLFSRYNGCLWKGGKLKLEKAKEHYLERLKREWAKEAEIVRDKPETSLEPDRGISYGEIPNREILKTKQLRIFFPKLRKVKPIPFSGTGKHKYSFQNVEAPPLPVHFCDCEEHSSPIATTRGKQWYDGEAERGRMNDEEISIMNAVMNKLFEKEKVLNTMHSEKEQISHESTDDLQSDEYEADSASDEDDIIINMETKKKKTALIGSLELARMLENQESGLNKTRISEEDPNKSNAEIDGDLGNSSSHIEATKELTESPPTNKVVASNQSGRGASWLRKQSWTQMVGGNNNTFSISQILPDISFPKPVVVEPIVDFSKPMAKEPIADSSISNGCKHHDLGKHPDKESVGDGYNLKSIPEKDQHARGNEYTPLVERKAEIAPMETSAADVKMGETCSFMRSAKSLREWAKTKAALSGSLKRKRSEK